MKRIPLWLAIVAIPFSPIILLGIVIIICFLTITWLPIAMICTIVYEKFNVEVPKYFNLDKI